MLNKPEKCAEMGTYECQILMPINGRVRGIDLCVADIVAALNAANMKTDMSCCGHGKMPGLVSLEDGRHLVIFDKNEDVDAVIYPYMNKGE